MWRADAKGVATPSADYSCPAGACGNSEPNGSTVSSFTVFVTMYVK